MKRSSTRDNEAPYRNRDMKSRVNRHDAEEGAHIMRIVTILMVFASLSALAWMLDRPNHPFKEVVQVVKK